MWPLRGGGEGLNKIICFAASLVHFARINVIIIWTPKTKMLQTVAITEGLSPI